ncbi:two-component system, CitB family, sensor kinase [Cryobacterium flavum]|uniref:Two-component system, CitB family, sensor kinase n=1 Tax=Cryobacterium flavum TaxID=1424659 RepID=A0A4R8V1T8_9MICO|nr:MULTISPECIES: hypothetical protein [Cryobacterium]TFB74733.1 hypothetical protein E3O21_15415 [Cryobacterium flavum]SDO46907.1 two-component system, CitB family, sensor kinase [Cryobacterium flavum]
MAKSTIAAEKGIRLVIDEGSILAPDGTTDPVTVLGNLIDNAMEAICADGTILVRLGTDRHRHYLRRLRRRSGNQGEGPCANL